MLPKLFTLAALSGLTLAAIPPLLPLPPRFSCGTQTTPEILSAAQDMLASELLSGTLPKRADLEIRLYVHVVSTSNSTSDGNVDNFAVIRQLQVMNDRFAPQGIHFNLAGLDRTVNADWANDRDELAMKRALRKGTYKDLNLYVQTNPRSLGYCSLPGNVGAAPGSDGYVRDGCTVNYITVPRAPSEQATDFNTGIAAVHEAGHWFGLLHTFDGNSCSGPGDYVDDTPQQASFTSACPASRDSCPGLPGADPIHNYMDYSNDGCKTEFTAGQRTRMFNMFNQFRAGK